jgi:hypothetical protein
VAGGFSFYNELTKVLPGVITQLYRELLLENGLVVPTMADLSLGDLEVLRDLLEGVGDAEVVGATATDFPIVDASMEQDRYKVLMLGAGISMDANTEEALKRSGKYQTYLEKKLKLVRRAIAELSQKIACYGRAASGMTGFFNNPNVAVVNSSFDPWDPALTAKQLRSFLIDQQRAFYRANNFTRMPDSLACTPDLALRMEELLLENNVPVLDYIRGENRRIRNFYEVVECGSDKLEANGVHAGGFNRDRMVFFNRDDMVLERHNMPTTAAPAKYVQIKGLTETVPFMSLTSPVIVNQPQMVQYVTVAKED